MHAPQDYPQTCAATPPTRKRTHMRGPGAGQPGRPRPSVRRVDAAQVPVAQGERAAGVGGRCHRVRVPGGPCAPLQQEQQPMHVHAPAALALAGAGAGVPGPCRQWCGRGRAAECGAGEAGEVGDAAEGMFLHQHAPHSLPLGAQPGRCSRGALGAGQPYATLLVGSYCSMASRLPACASATSPPSGLSQPAADRAALRVRQQYECAMALLDRTRWGHGAGWAPAGLRTRARARVTRCMCTYACGGQGVGEWVHARLGAPPSLPASAMLVPLLFPSA